MFVWLYDVWIVKDGFEHVELNVASCFGSFFSHFFNDMKNEMKSRGSFRYEFDVVMLWRWDLVKVMKVMKTRDATNEALEYNINESKAYLENMFIEFLGTEIDCKFLKQIGNNTRDQTLSF